MPCPRLPFHVAAGADTGSCFRLMTDHDQALIDCGTLADSACIRAIGGEPFNRCAGERLSRSAERLAPAAKTDDVLRQMLEASVRRPRDRDVLFGRLRGWLAKIEKLDFYGAARAEEARASRGAKRCSTTMPGACSKRMTRTDEVSMAIAPVVPQSVLFGAVGVGALTWSAHRARMADPRRHFLHWRDRQRQRAAPLDLDERPLRDCGLTRDQAECEGRRLD